MQVKYTNTKGQDRTTADMSKEEAKMYADLMLEMKFTAVRVVEA